MSKTDKMSYTQFIKAVAENIGVSEDIVRRAYDNGIEVIGTNAYRGRPVEIRNFGIFGTKKAQGRNVQLNNVSGFDAYTKFQFKPSSHFTRHNRMLIGEIGEIVDSET
jgi:nucleoid DNA-binding protein